MPKQKDFKKIVRSRMRKTGESYTAARSHLRPQPQPENQTPAAGAPFASGRHADTAALARVLASLGVRAPHTGRPFSEEMLFGIGGGIGLAYCVFEYPEFTSLYVGGKINPWLQEREFVEAVFARLGVPAALKQTTGAATAEKHLREALAAGRQAIAAVDQVSLPYYALPRELSGMMPHTVVVAAATGAKNGRGDEDGALVYDLAPHPFRMSWKELAAARGRIRSAKHRLLVAEPSKAPPDLARAITEGVRETCRGLFEPPMKSFGLAALEKWAALVSNAKDKRGWATVFKDGVRLYSGLKWLVCWLETTGTGGGNFRAMYAGFLEEAAAALGRSGIREVAALYRGLAAEWSALAQAALPDSAPPLGRTRQLLLRKQHLIEQRGAQAGAEIDRVERELASLAAEMRRSFPLDAAARGALLADLHARIIRLHEGEQRAARALRAACP